MLDSNHKQHLFRAMESNNCILFVGAGFSRGATNRLGRPIPLAQELSKDLGEWVGLSGEDKEPDLAIVYQAALTSGRPLSELRAFLEERLLAVELADWYAVIPRGFWFRIYGTNVDNVVERSYHRGPTEVTLELVSAPLDEVRERDQFLRRIQYVKLHGSVPGDPRALTFSTLQYAKRANLRDDWWHHFVRDYAFHPTLFVGSEVDEPLFWQAMAAREDRARNPEERPKSYLVTPSLSSARRSVLEEYNIVHVPGTGEDFFRWLGAEFGFPDRQAVLSLVSPESAEILEHRGVTTRLRDALAGFLSVFQRVPLAQPNPARPKFFFLGAPPTWEDIAAGFDATREINGTFLQAVEAGFAEQKQLTVLALLGEGGAGKSTILRRTALSLRQGGRDVFFSDGATRVEPATLREAIQVFPGKTCLFIDNASLLGPSLSELVKGLSTVPIPPIVVFASRYIPFEQRLKATLDGHRFQEIEIPWLTDQDIEQIIATLHQHNQLGHLGPLSHEGRRYEIKQRARKQILVALREATEGRGFDEIIASEYAQITETEPRVLFLCAALGTAALVDLTEKQWFDCTEVTPATALRILRRDLRGLVYHELVGRERLIAARHPLIAERILDTVAGRGDVMEAYRRTLSALSRDIYPGPGRRSRAWRLFVRLINHASIYERFGEDIERARGVFELTADAFANDGHFWLQYASLEVECGLPEYARSHLANAEGLLGDTELVLNTKAHMMLREALTVGSYEDARRLRREAEEILLKQMERTSGDDEYAHHVFLTHILGWIRAWAPDNDAKKKELESLLRTAKSACELMPHNRKLKGVYDAIQREYLSLAVSAPGAG